MLLDIVDIKPSTIEDLAEVITASSFHPQHGHIFAYSTSKGAVKIGDMREAALCDRQSKGKFLYTLTLLHCIYIAFQCSRPRIKLTPIHFSMKWSGHFQISNSAVMAGTLSQEII